MLIKTTLTNEGYDVITATNGMDGLALAEEERPDLIILDLLMPEMDGFEVLEQLKANEVTGEIPVIVVSAVSEKDKVKAALTRGIDYYIIKPFDYNDLLSKVHLALGEL
ncbi:response regulator [Candidatus Sumerlaeota bacterium]|nr:response regulator [Candidatus Sumerlaeota bacterium]